MSQSTVSLVLTGKDVGRINPETREKVIAATEALAYRRNASARALRLGVANALALVIPDVKNPFFASVLVGAEKAARGRSHQLVLVETGNDRGWQDYIVDTLSAQLIDGFVLCAVDPLAETSLGSHSGRVVVVDGETCLHSSICIDAEGGARQAMQHLLALGHRRIAHLAAGMMKRTFIDRSRAYSESLAQAGIPLLPAYETEAPFSFHEAREAAARLLRQEPRPTAVFCDDDLFAVGIYKVAKELGLQIPKDLSVVGFDDIEVAQVLEPELTTVRVPAEELGARSVNKLLDLLDGLPPCAQEKMPLELVIRGSTSRAA